MVLSILAQFYLFTTMSVNGIINLVSFRQVQDELFPGEKPANAVQGYNKILCLLVKQWEGH